MTYTPGPWQAFSYAINKNLITICAGGSVICNVVDGHSGNARLIAAAPDLLAACGRAEAELSRIWGDQQSHSEETLTDMCLVDANAIEQCRAAIAKAEGGGS